MPFPFPIPSPVPLVPQWFPRSDRGNDSEKDVFGVSPDEIEAVVRSWRANGIAIHAIDTAPLGDARGSSSRVARALRDTAGPAGRAVESIGDRLIAMSEILATFEATTTSTDARAAATFEALRDR